MRGAAILAGLVLATNAASASRVIVTVTGVRDARGTVRVAICPKQDFLKPVCPFVGRSAAASGSVVVTIDNVPPGVYAAQAYNDANNNGVLDRNWLGMPLEGMGFSHNAPFRFGPPSFADAAFSVGQEDARITFRLRYF